MRLLLAGPILAAVIALAPGMAAGQTAGAASAPGEEAQVHATEVPGNGQVPPAPRPIATAPGHGDITFNFPGADVRIIAQAVLGDALHLHFAVAPGIVTPVTLVTPYPIARGAVLPLLEDALGNARLALVVQNGVYTVMPLDQARVSGPVGVETSGFGKEIVRLQFVGAVQMKALLDPVLPGVVSGIDPGSNVLTLAGTRGQRASARDILRQFDVNWLRNMSFALFVPQRTDARLIVPELDKLINAPDAPTRSMVRLIAMDGLNGILAVSAQNQYLADVRRWIEVLDREGQNNEEQLFVYRVQNGRSKDLVKTLNLAFGGGGSTGPAETANGGAAGAGPPGGTGTGGGLIPGMAGPGTAGPGTGADAGRQPQPGAAGTAPSTVRRLNATISSDDNNNAVIVFGSPHDYGVVLAALRKLDVAPYQIMIEAAITEVSLTDDLRYGLQWQFASGETSGNLTQNTSALDLVRSTPGFSMLFTHGQTLSAVLNTLEGKTRINVISAPKLMVLNNQTAALQVGDQVPILTQSSTSTIGNSATINSVDYRDTGVILKITPRVNESGQVMLDVSQEVSDVKATTTTGISSPTISTRRISTTVSVQDGEVIALGGLIRNTETRDKSGIPWLSQIPILGALAGKQGRVKDKIELIVLIKPHVIRTADDARRMTEDLQSKIKAVQSMSPTGSIP